MEHSLHVGHAEDLLLQSTAFMLSIKRIVVVAQSLFWIGRRFVVLEQNLHAGHTEDCCFSNTTAMLRSIEVVVCGAQPPCDLLINGCSVALPLCLEVEVFLLQRTAFALLTRSRASFLGMKRLWTTASMLDIKRFVVAEHSLHVGQLEYPFVHSAT